MILLQPFSHEISLKIWVYECQGYKKQCIGVNVVQPSPQHNNKLFNIKKMSLSYIKNTKHVIINELLLLPLEKLL